MNLTYACPYCEQSVRVEVPPDAEEFDCPACGHANQFPARLFDDGRLCRCAVCPSTDLFMRKDFPQRLGVAIVTIGFVLSSITWGMGYPLSTYAILFATALIDVILYIVMPNVLMCYRCGAQYRGLDTSEDNSYETFQLETHERYRQQKIRLAEHQATVPKLPTDA